jgi:uncharacterized membrane protein YphA (DoxX/SURF4 family)
MRSGKKLLWLGTEESAPARCLATGTLAARRRNRVDDFPIKATFWRFSVATRVSALVWVGRVISGLAACAFLFSGFMKLKGGDELVQGMAHLGLPDSMARPLAIVELACAVIYVIPTTAVLGAILLAGYMGGAICTHWRVGDSFLPQIAIGVAVWLGLWLRESRLRSILPLRFSAE